MKIVLGTKDGMTQVFDGEGVAHPATVLRVEPMVISALKTADKDGYEAVQLATGEQKSARLGKADLGHQGGAKKLVKEFRVRTHLGESPSDIEAGTTLDASVFAAGDLVTVSAVSKGKGFQGVVKRHNFSGANKTHGTKHNLRAPGSIGATGINRVLKGKKMAGRMGGDRVTVKNLQVLQVNQDENLLLIKGAVPGRRGTVVEVREVTNK